MQVRWVYDPIEDGHVLQAHHDKGAVELLGTLKIKAEKTGRFWCLYTVIPFLVRTERVEWCLGVAVPDDHAAFVHYRSLAQVAALDLLADRYHRLASTCLAAHKELTSTFMAQVLRGEETPDSVHTYIQKWLYSPVGRQLHDFLGLTEEEFIKLQQGAWSREALNQVIDKRKAM